MIKIYNETNGMRTLAGKKNNWKLYAGRWFNKNNKEELSIGGNKGAYHVFLNKQRDKSPSQNATLKVFKTKKQAKLYTYNYMNLH